MKFFNQCAAEPFRVIFIAAFWLALATAITAQTPTGNAQPNDVFILTAERLRSEWEGGIWDADWRYQSGDNKAWATVDFDDRDWEKLKSTQLNPKLLPASGWNGTAWFRLHISVDERLAREPLALRLVHWGASEIYLDGKLLRSFGKIAANDDAGGAVEENPRAIPIPLTFETGGEHVIAVRYSFAAAGDLSKGTGAWLARGRFLPGFSVYIQTASGAINDSVADLRDTGSYKFFNGILYAFALLHFLLFVFYRRERTNLFYSLFAFCLASASTFSNIVNGRSQTAVVSAILFVFFVTGYAAAFLALQAFLYEAFVGRFSKFFRLTVALSILLVLLLGWFVRDLITLYATSFFLLISLADSLRLVVLAVWRRRDGAWIIASGVLTFAGGIFIIISREFQYFRDSELMVLFSDLAVALAVPVAVSIFLARNFARTNRHLEAQLVQVKELSERELEQSRRAAELALESEQEKARFALVEAENQRQAKELEEARQLQLSMLPKKLPQIPNIEIAAYMKPATEVGGDYYDFHVGADGTLTVAVGDATGHGLKAGTVVTATKGLFNNLASTPDIADTFGQISRSLKAMNLRGLFMAMTMLKINGSRAVICMAGMPSILIYRAENRQVEEIAIRAMPLGSFSKSPYASRELSLSAGDVVVLMSDGFPEMFNETGEMLADETAKNLLGEIAAASPQEIINRFVEAGEKWAGTRPPDDDVTFVVLKVKDDNSL